MRCYHGMLKVQKTRKRSHEVLNCYWECLRAKSPASERETPRSNNIAQVFKVSRCGQRSWRKCWEQRLAERHDRTTSDQTTRWWWWRETKQGNLSRPRPALTKAWQQNGTYGYLFSCVWQLTFYNFRKQKCTYIYCVFCAFWYLFLTFWIFNAFRECSIDFSIPNICTYEYHYFV